MKLNYSKQEEQTGFSGKYKISADAIKKKANLFLLVCIPMILLPIIAIIVINIVDIPSNITSIINLILISLLLIIIFAVCFVYFANMFVMSQYCVERKGNKIVINPKQMGIKTIIVNQISKISVKRINGKKMKILAFTAKPNRRYVITPLCLDSEVSLILNTLFTEEEIKSIYK